MIKSRAVLTLLVATAFAWPGAALAQQAAPAQAPKPAAPKPAAPKPAAAKPAAPKPAAAKPAAAAQASTAPAAVAQATLLGQFGDWGAYTASPNGRKVCFALAKPTASQDNPPNRRTAANAVYLFISSRPAEKVKDEVSILVTGYQFKAATEASLAVGNTPFSMYTQNDGAWVKNSSDEAKLVNELRKSADLVVKGTTSRGTQTTDTFSLKGIGQALDRVAQECK